LFSRKKEYIPLEYKTYTKEPHTFNQ